MITPAPDRLSVHISLKVGARLFMVERVRGWVSTLRDAPFIWTVLYVKVDCDGHTSATLTYSDFPSTVAYQDGAQSLDDQQPADFIRLMKAGGYIPSLPSKGKLSPVCHIYEFPGSTTDSIPQ